MRKYDITLSPSILSTISPEMAQWTMRIEHEREGPFRGIVPRMERNARVRNVYSDRTIQYNTRERSEPEHRFLRSMNRSSSPCLRGFDSCTRIRARARTHMCRGRVERREMSRTVVVAPSIAASVSPLPREFRDAYRLIETRNLVKPM